MDDQILRYTFISIFVVTAIVTILAISNIPPFKNMDSFFKKGLYAALLVQLIGVVVAAGKEIFLPSGRVDRYIWQITYPQNLRQGFETLHLADPSFAAFYEKNKNMEQSGIQTLHANDSSISRATLDRYLDSIFQIKKAEEFAGRKAQGELFLISQNGQSRRFGKAVLTFPGETDPIAFGVAGDPALATSWHIEFSQPDRYVPYENRVNKWAGGLLKVDFETKSGKTWTGQLHYNGVYIGTFSLDKD